MFDGTGGKGNAKSTRTLNVRSDGVFEHTLPVNAWTEVRMSHIVKLRRVRIGDGTLKLG